MHATPFPDDFGPNFGRWLAPFVADELRRQGFNVQPPADWNDAACEALTRELGVNSLNRAGDFFAKLDADGAVDSVTMGVHLGVGTPRNISSALTTPVKRLSKRLGFPTLPWSEEESPEGRTIWRDRDGIAGRMHEAVRAEQYRRQQAPGQH